MHGNFKHGKYIYRKLAFEEYKMKAECECGSTDCIIIHHIDEDRKNNTKNNLRPMCNSCHTKLHYNKDRKKRQSSMMKNNKLYLGRSHSEETKKKIGEKLKGNNHMLGKKHTKETLQKMKVSHIGKKHLSESKIKMSIARKKYWEKRRNETDYSY